MAEKARMPSKKKKSDQSHPQMAPPIVPASAASPMPTMNSMPPYICASHIPFNPYLAEPGGIYQENTQLRSVHGSDRDTVLPLGHILTSGGRSTRHGFPHRQDNHGHQAAITYTFKHENPSENLKKDATASDKKHQRMSAQRLTIEAGGSCIWCYKRRKQCNSEVPCPNCRRNERDENDCVRGGYSSLYMALMIKHRSQFEPDPDCFKKAQETLARLKQDIQPFASPIAIRWVFRDQPCYGTFLLAADQLDLHQADTTLGKELVDLAQRSIPVIRQQHEPEELSNYAHRVLGVLAIMKRLFASVCSTEAVTIKTARAIVFFLMTIYTMELCEVSLRLAKGLYRALNKKSSATECKEYVIPAYIQAIDGMINLQWPHSLMSDIFTHVQPPDQLRNLQELLRQLVLDGGVEPTSDANQNFDSDLPQFDIMIGFPYEMRGTSVPVGFIQRLRQGYSVNVLLRSDFDESMENSTTGPQTINPSLLLSPEISWDSILADNETSTALDSGYDPAIFSYGTETQNTEITCPPLDSPDFFARAYESTLAMSNSAIEPSPEDFAQMGEHLS